MRLSLPAAVTALIFSSRAVALRSYPSAAAFFLLAIIVVVLSESLRVAKERAARAEGNARSTEGAVRLERQRTETVLGSVSDGIVVYDSGGNVEYANDAIGRMFADSTGESMIGLSAEDFHSRLGSRDPQGHSLSPDRLPVRLALTGHEGREQILCHGESASIHWALVRANPVFDEAGNVVRVVSVFHDITDRIERERSLEDSARNLHQMAARLEVTVERLRLEREKAVVARADAEDSLRRMVALQSLAGALAEAATAEEVGTVVLERGIQALCASNGALLAFAAQDDSLEVVRTWAIPTEQIDRWTLERSVDRVRLAGVLRREGLPATSRSRDGSPDDIEGRVASDALRGLMGSDTLALIALSARDRPLGLLAFSLPANGVLGSRDRDFLAALGRHCAQALDRTRLFAAERQARQDAELASRAKTEFLAVVSHELRTPLNAILGYEELLETEVAGKMSDVQKHHLSRIRESTRHLLALIEQILSLSRTQTGKEDMRIESVDAIALARDAAALLAPQIQRKGLTLDLLLPEGEVGVRTDPRKVRQILLNLLSNAVKFTDSGAVKLELSRNDESLAFRVRDTGRGIGDQDRERIFEPFFQIQYGDGTPTSGTGLGLPVARELARHLGGDVTLESHPGEGSTFTVYLPHEGVSEPNELAGREDQPTGILPPLALSQRPQLT